MERFSIRVAGIQFSASHFITLGPDMCEALHGHNYTLAAEIEGPLNDEGLLVDFLAVQHMLREIAAAFDHRVLLPSSNPAIHVIATEGGVKARFGRQRWLFPPRDCVLLPLANTTAELIAQHVGQGLCERLAAMGARWDRVRVELAEGADFSAAWQSAGPNA
jgi:6-pyruvoyltetrahydropterin/6-carboxytetrahydropterin synthase